MLNLPVALNLNIHVWPAPQCYGIDVVVILTSQIILEVGGHCLAVEVGGVLDNYVRRILS